MGTNTKIAKSAGIISLGTIISRVLGFVRDMVMARFFGTAIYAQAFVVSFRIPNLMRDLVAEGATNAAVVPVLSEYRATHTDKEFWRLASSIFKIVSLALAVIVALGVLFSPFVVRIIAPGFVNEPHKLKVTVTLTRMLFPFLFFMGLVAFTTGVLNSRNRFTIPSFGQGIVNVSMIACIFLFYSRLKIPIYGLAFGVLLGGLIQAIMQSLPLLKQGMRLEFKSFTPHPVRLWRTGGIPPHERKTENKGATSARLADAVAKWVNPWGSTIPREAMRMGILLIPRVIGSCIYQMNVFVDTMLASLSNIVGDGGVAALYYSNRLVQFPLAIFGISLAQAALPTMSAQAATNNIDELRRTLSFSLRQILLVMLPSALGLIVLGRPIIRILFERGEFNAYSTAITNTALFYYSFGLFAYAGVKILTSCFYSLQDTKTPVKVSCVCLILNLILNLILMWPLKIGGLALATSITSSVNFFLLAKMLRRRLSHLDGARILRSFFKIFLASLIMALASFFIYNKLSSLFNGAGALSELTVLLCAVISSMAIFFIFCFIFRVEEATGILKWMSKKR